MVGAETFILKTNINCPGCKKKIKKLLQDVQGVDKISIDAEQGRIKISGTVHPQTLMKLLQKNGKKSELLWEPMVTQKDLQIVRRSKSPVNNHHIIHDKDVEQLQKLSEIKGLTTVEVTRNGMKITFKEDENVPDEFSAARRLDQRAMHKKYNGDHGTNNYDCDFQSYHHQCSCSRNQAMYMHYCRNCPPTNCRCMQASDGNISVGIPLPGYMIPSAPQVPEYYQDPTPQEKSYDHPFHTAFSDDNPTGCIIL